MSAGNEREFIDFQQNKEKGGRSMFCPLRSISVVSIDEKLTPVMGDCLKEECAWWYRENHACSILTLAQGSTYIHKVLLEMAQKMPRVTEPHLCPGQSCIDEEHRLSPDYLDEVDRDAHYEALREAERDKRRV